MVVEGAGAVRDVEPRVLRLLEVGEPSFPSFSPGEGGAELVLAFRRLHEVGHPELERERGEPLQLRVRTPEDGVDPRDHLRDRLVGDVGEGLPAKLVEDEVGAVAEVEELEVVLPDAIEPFQEPVVGDEELVARAPPASLGHDRLLLDLGQLRHLESLELRRCTLDLASPVRVELVPVLVVVAAARREELRSPVQLRGVGDRVGTHVLVAVEDPVLGSER